MASQGRDRAGRTPDGQQGEAVPTPPRPGRGGRLHRRRVPRHAVPRRDRPAHRSRLGRRHAVPVAADHLAGAAAMTGLRLVGFTDLTEPELDTWRRLRADNPLLDSPYFDPAFAAAVQASGVEVTVAVDGRGAALSSLMACQRDGSVLRPVGWPGADFQGPVLAPGAAFDPRELLVDGVRAFEFDHWLLPSPGVEPWLETRAASPYVEVTGGLDGYLSRASKSGRDNFSQARRRTARAERELGAVRFSHSPRIPRHSPGWSTASESSTRPPGRATTSRPPTVGRCSRCCWRRTNRAAKGSCRPCTSGRHSWPRTSASGLAARCTGGSRSTTRTSPATHRAGSCCGSWRTSRPSSASNGSTSAGARTSTSAERAPARSRWPPARHQDRGPAGPAQGAAAAVTAAKASPSPTAPTGRARPAQARAVTNAVGNQ